MHRSNHPLTPAPVRHPRRTQGRAARVGVLGAAVGAAGLMLAARAGIGLLAFSGEPGPGVAPETLSAE